MADQSVSDPEGKYRGQVLSEWLKQKKKSKNKQKKP